jgi:hypothetical protein
MRRSDKQSSTSVIILKKDIIPRSLFGRAQLHTTITFGLMQIKFRFLNSGIRGEFFYEKHHDNKLGKQKEAGENPPRSRMESIVYGLRLSAVATPSPASVM